MLLSPTATGGSVLHYQGLRAFLYRFVLPVRTKLGLEVHSPDYESGRPALRHVEGSVDHRAKSVGGTPGFPLA